MRILRRVLIAIVVLLVIAGVVVATCPASFAWRLVADRLGSVQLAAISGSVWRGHAGSAQVFGQELGALDWQIDAAALLHGDLRAHLDVHGGEVTANGVIVRHPDGTLDVGDAKIAFPAALAAPALDIPALVLHGQIDVDVTHARVSDAWIETATGSARWHNAAVSGAAQAQFGDLETTFASTPDGAIAGVVHDLGGPLQLNGTFKVSAGSFDADAVLAARDGNPQVVEALRYIGQPQADGSAHLIIHGGLFKWL